jgi:hypothetical protein
MHACSLWTPEKSGIHGMVEAAIKIYRKRPWICSDPMVRSKVVTCEVILNACVGIIEALNNTCKYI